MQGGNKLPDSFPALVISADEEGEMEVGTAMLAGLPSTIDAIWFPIKDSFSEKRHALHSAP